MKILLTGASGFIGQHVWDYLVDQGHDVVALDRYGYDITLYKIDMYCERQDLGSLFIENEFDYVIHLAAERSVPKSIENPKLFYNNNIEAFNNILEFSSARKIKKFIYASSSSVYGNAPNPKTEGDEGRPLSPYAATKQFNEMWAEQYSKIYGIKCIGLRFFNVFGPGDNSDLKYMGVINKWIHNIKNNLSCTINSVDVIRDFTYIKDVVKSIDLAINMDMEKKKLHHRVYNVASGEPIMMAHVPPTIRKVLKEKDVILKSSAFSIGKPRPGDVKVSFADLTYAKEELGYKPEYNLESGLRDWL